jgi:hypothetical protein
MNLRTALLIACIALSSPAKAEPTYEQWADSGARM